MAKTAYEKTALTGGGALALDGIASAGLLDGDFAFTMMLTGKLYSHTYDDDSGVADDGVNVIAPDDIGAGLGRWIAAAVLDEAVAMSSKAPKTATIAGDGTAGRVIRISTLIIDDGTIADTVKCTLATQWNGDPIGATDNIAKGATTGNFSLSADGKELRILNSGIFGNAVAVLAFYLIWNATALVFDSQTHLLYASKDASGILAYGGYDWTTIGAGTQIQLVIVYLTSA